MIGTEEPALTSTTIDDPEPTTARAVIRCRDLAVRRGRRLVLRDVHWRVAAGDLWFVLGRNGAGKSTLLETVLGGLTPHHGEMERDPELDHPVGYVPQQCSMDPSLPTTTFEFVDLGLTGLSLARAERRERTAAALAAVDVDTGPHRSLWSHSDGQRQRVLLARALAREPRLLVMDEPTSSLDPRGARRFWDLVARLHQERGLTVVCASHDLQAASRYASHLAVCTPVDHSSAATLATGPTARLLADGVVDRIFGTSRVTIGERDE